ncbi:hypothetical protein KAJ87_03730 [Candidatus Pacearchaeota archaeon]|nr:hypothetical protein [Candidatus Pacearchaeota archaeon]
MAIKDVIIGIAIIVMTILVSFYGINTFYPKPDYDDFCGDVKTQELIETQERCEELEGKWIVHERIEPVENLAEGFCDRDYYCRQDLEEAEKVRSRNVFLIALPLAILLIIVGAFLFKLESVGAGLMGGGIGTLIYGAGAYWPYSENWIRFILSLVALIILVGLAYWFSKKFGKKK